MRASPLLLALAACTPARTPAPAPTMLAVAARVDTTAAAPDSLTREPAIAEHPNGTLFVAGFGTDTAPLWKSTDHGATWTRVAFGADTAGALGNSDVDLAVAADGTLYLASMTFDREKMEGTQLAVATSRDSGATWSWTVVSRHRFDDRPWVDVAPDGAAHVIWNDGKGVNHAVSRDRGASWQTPRSRPTASHTTRSATRAASTSRSRCSATGA